MPRNVKEDVAFLKLLEAAEFACNHMDTYRNEEGHEQEIESQQRAFDLLRPAIENARKIFRDE